MLNRSSHLQDRRHHVLFIPPWTIARHHHPRQHRPKVSVMAARIRKSRERRAPITLIGPSSHRQPGEILRTASSPVELRAPCFSAAPVFGLVESHPCSWIFVGGTEASEGELWAGWRLWLFFSSLWRAGGSFSTRIGEVVLASFA